MHAALAYAFDVNKCVNTLAPIQYSETEATHVPVRPDYHFSSPSDSSTLWSIAYLESSN